MDALAALSTLVALLVMFSFYLSWRATRLDRLHTRLETAHAALDAALARRGAAVGELALAGVLDPASSVLLADAAAHARRAEGQAAREFAESTLSRTLRAVLAEDDPPHQSGDLVTEAHAAAKRVYIARRFYNDAVTAIHIARSARLVSALRLAGRAPMPGYFEMDDELPEPGPVG